MSKKDLTPHIRLISAITKRAVDDLRSGDPVVRDSAKLYLIEKGPANLALIGISRPKERIEKLVSNF